MLLPDRLAVTVTLLAAVTAEPTLKATISGCAAFSLTCCAAMGEISGPVVCRLRDQPLVIQPPFGYASSCTYKYHQPFGLTPLNADAKVSAYGPTGGTGFTPDCAKFGLLRNALGE